MLINLEYVFNNEVIILIIVLILYIIKISVSRYLELLDLFITYDL